MRRRAHLATTQDSNGNNIVYVNGVLMAQTNFVSSFASGADLESSNRRCHVLQSYSECV